MEKKISEKLALWQQRLQQSDNEWKSEVADMDQREKRYNGDMDDILAVVADPTPDHPERLHRQHEETIVAATERVFSLVPAIDVLVNNGGISQRSCCAAEAKRCSNSMLPVSGALQLNTSEAQCSRPMVSASGA